jgi:hypothetical protein
VDTVAALLFSDAMMGENWAETAETDLKKMNTDKFGRPFKHPDSVVAWGMMYKAANRLSYRAALGVVNMIIRRHGLPEMSLSQFYGRAQEIAEKEMFTCDVTDARVLAYGTGDVPPKDGAVVAVDSTGMSLNKYGGWLAYVWKKVAKAGWVKLHVLADTDTNEVLSYVITDESCGDVSCIERLVELAQGAGHRPAKILADAAYDKISLWKKYAEEGIEFVANIKSSLLKKYKGGRVKSNGCPKRAAHIRFINKEGRDAWKALVGYGRRWKVECVFSDLKRKHGDMMRARDRYRMAAELFWIVRCHNRYKAIRASVASERKVKREV